MTHSSAYDPKYALNAICPYFTMFPLEYPLHILKKHKRDNAPVVFDPFCGRGTTIYAAREMGLSSWGIDSSPIAVAIARAKLASASVEQVLALAENMLNTGSTNIPNSEFFRAAYHPQTLQELCSLRDGLLTISEESDVSILLRAAVLGCLHGPKNKTASSASYFSNQMPRTFASKPDYSLNYWQKNALEAPNVRVIDVLRRKLMRITNLNSLSYSTPKQILFNDSRLPEAYTTITDDFSVVITSPPYYGMKTYIQDQWLRMWFLGGSETVDYKVKEQLNHTGHQAFTKSLADVWKNIHNSSSDRLDLYIRFGIVPSIKSDAKMILKASLEEAKGWKVISVRNAKTAHQGKRQADQMAPGSRAGVEFDFHAIRA